MSTNTTSIEATKPMGRPSSLGPATGSVSGQRCSIKRPYTVIRIDAHQHYWSLQRGDYGWLTPRETALYRDFEPEHLSQELVQCAVDATVLVQAAPTEAESRFLLDLARRHPSIAGVVGWVDFEAPDVAERISNLVRDGQGMLKDCGQWSKISAIRVGWIVFR